jgi:transcriptional regulator with XRE-family HTH domain
MSPITPSPDPWIRGFLQDVLERIRSRRMALGLTQKEVADRLDWARTTVSAIELGRQALSLEHLVHLACALRVDPWQLLPHTTWNADERQEAKKAAKRPGRQRPRRRFRPAARDAVQ